MKNCWEAHSNIVMELCRSGKKKDEREEQTEELEEEGGDGKRIEERMREDRNVKQRNTLRGITRSVPH